MNQDDNHPIRELQWLAHYFEEHGREDVAREIFARVREIRRYEQSSRNENLNDFSLNANRKIDGR